MMCRLKLFSIIIVVLWQSIALAKVDLVILPKRDTVQLTIYNSADLTLVRERRALTLKEGVNQLQFSWANTLIDPTSLEMFPKMHGKEIDILDIVFPPRVSNLGLWHIESRISGNVPMAITYLTSGLSWRAFYMGTLTEDEKTMRLQGYVRATNKSGEDYENARVRLIVGKINLVDRIADLARRQYPYGRPGPVPGDVIQREAELARAKMITEAKCKLAQVEEGMLKRPKEIKKEGLSEYFLYTIEGKETIPDGWSKRLPSFDVSEVPVINLYKYEEERYGREVIRFLSFKNDKKHNLGNTPIPGGVLKVHRNLDKMGHLSYEGQSSFKYIPVNEDIELNLGPVSNVIVRSTMMEFKTNNYSFDSKGNITGWDEMRGFEVVVKNTHEIPVKVEIKRNFNTSSWDLKKSGDFGKYKKVDIDTVKFILKLNSRGTKKFSYILTTHHGRRDE
ncbi:MAG: DUF4139 domain-containing protein [Thermodesulfobacteriota bacterium]|nr:DUF4139 domain-containing protein [Thermodesulfobacteriota bacterium]